MSTDRPILILGGSGRLGTALCERLESDGRAHVAPGIDELDLRRLDRIERSIARAAPSTVINAAAFTDVARAEHAEERPVVEALNRDAPGAIAAACRRLGIPLVHVSTDYVFDGRTDRPYVESDPPAPLQVYGRSKLEGERRVAEAFAQAIVARTSTVFGRSREGRSNYIDAILAQARAGRDVRVVRPPTASPTWSVDLAHGLLRLLAVGAEGLVHVVNAGSCSRLELARAAVAAARLDAVGVGERPEDAGGVRRPAYCVLDDARFAELTGERLPGWRRAVTAYVRSRGETGR